MARELIPVSIFNDVIGPVMRGPSSSHCAAALRIGRLARDVMDGVLQEVLVEYDNHGSLATTHHSQGSDMGLFAGLLGWDPTDERLPNSEQAIRESGVQIVIKTRDLHDPHPNTYHLTLTSTTERHTLRVLSKGGGMIEVIAVDDICLSISGDYFETLILFTGSPRKVPTSPLQADHVLVHEGQDGLLVQIKAQRFIDDREIFGWLNQEAVTYAKRLSPILPVLSRQNMRVPFSTAAEMLDHAASDSTALWELAAQYESERAGLSPQKVVGRMEEIVRILRSSVASGLQGTLYTDRILGYQCGTFQERMEAGGLLDAGVLNRIVLYVTALMEVKSSMGVIVAAPTAGACAALPGACLAVTDALSLTEEDAAKALLAGGIIGVLIATKCSFAAEVAGCQAECGSASAMTAAALVTLAAGNAAQAVAAASMALQNSLGMVCDPVANRVEVPCLGKNVMAATNALACANMALADYDPVIPLDEVIEAADRVGRAIPRELRCTALGGLSVTDTSKEIENRLPHQHKQQPRKDDY